MKTTHDSISISGALSVRLDAVTSLKVLNNNLLIELQDGVVVEIRNLSDWKVDETFRSYSQFLRHRSIENLSHHPD